MAVTSAEMFALKQDIKEANNVAVEAQNAISTHEQLCALRYEGIAKELKDIKRIVAVGALIMAGLMKSEKFAEIIKMIGI